MDGLILGGGWALMWNFTLFAQDTACFETFVLSGVIGISRGVQTSPTHPLDPPLATTC